MEAWGWGRGVTLVRGVSWGRGGLLDNSQHWRSIPGGPVSKQWQGESGNTMQQAAGSVACPRPAYLRPGRNMSEIHITHILRVPAPARDRRVFVRPPPCGAV